MKEGEKDAVRSRVSTSLFIILGAVVFGLGALALTVMEVPHTLVPVIWELIAKHHV
jgi:hypothetical protein